MTSKEAYKILCKIIPNMYAEACYEYDSYFVFSMIPNGKKKVLDGLYSVDKKTGNVKGFSPMMNKNKNYKKVLGYK